MTSAFLALQLWLGKTAAEFQLRRCALRPNLCRRQERPADVGLIIHEGQLTYQKEGLVAMRRPGHLVDPAKTMACRCRLGGNVIHKRFCPETRSTISDVSPPASNSAWIIAPEAVAHALQYARNMGHELADQFVGMYVNHWTLDYGEKGRESIRRFLGQAHAHGLIPHRQELEFVD